MTLSIVKKHQNQVDAVILQVLLFTKFIMPVVFCLGKFFRSP